MSASDTRRRIAHIVEKVFGLSGLRPGQQAVIDAVLAGTHTLAIMPTGAGKSLCYQVPAMLMPGMMVVVSPLIALMQDQFEKMSELGIPSVQVNSAIPRDEVRRARKKIGRRTIEFVFTTPEQLASDQLRTLLASAHVDLLVIDEAHCITQWGHDFRPAYLEALGAMRALGTPTVLALTATAPPEVVDDIAQQLNLGPLHVVNTGAHRPNLSYHVRPVTSDTDKQRQLVELIRGLEGAAIVYAATVKHVEHIHALMRQEGVSAVSYHGRMRASDRIAAVRCMRQLSWHGDSRRGCCARRRLRVGKKRNDSHGSSSGRRHARSGSSAPRRSRCARADDRVRRPSALDARPRQPGE